MLPAFLTTILFSISAVAAQRSTRMLGGLVANFYRICLATVLLGLWAHLFGQGLSGASFPYFLLSGCIGFGVGDVALYQAFPLLGARLSILLVHCLAAPIAAVTEWLWLGSRLTKGQIGCGALILAGVSLALAPSDHLKTSARAIWIGTVLGTLAAAGQAWGAVFSRKAYQISAQAHQPIDGLTAAYQRILAGVLVAGLFLLWEKRRQRRRSFRDDAVPAVAGGDSRVPWRAAIPWISLNAIAGPALGVGCYQWALASAPTGIVLPIVALTPLVIIPFARWTEGERPTGRSLAGGVLAVAGVIVLTQLQP